ncbi:Glucose/arabinose dehydrogenase, beta-propeller fold [Microbacterium pygmaeum]|uniref:Glucose/arabinose dehydrogenase, beta-propeller fold n=2 Tax=Microbacterium pygmaeum TaxID=370764 RepID=A0A1G7XJK8_9MICO|nr:Glucose/arabinose dehydrogenase, beta-propeller fold [Microbacterium pygmaeum]
MRHPIRTAAVLATAGVLLAGCSARMPVSINTATAPNSFATSPMATLTGTPTEVVTGLGAPWDVVLFKGTALISSRNSGDILEVLPGGSTRLVGTVPDVQHTMESGLLGLAVGNDSTLFAYSTTADDNRIERFTVEGSAGSFSLGVEEVVVDGLPTNSFHDGGRIAFGPDGMLYASVGDAGNGAAAQDEERLNGKILRMTPDGAAPADNPFPGSLVYSLGHRNVQGLGWASDGTMFAAEFGQDAWDELNVIQAGANYGWPEVEGPGGGNDYVDPVQYWAPDDASPSGLTVIDDTIFIANLRGEVLRAVPTADLDTSQDYYAGEYGRLRSVLPGPDGMLWIVTNNTDGRGDPGDGDDRILQVPVTAP